MELNIWLFLLFFSAYFVDVKSNILDEMYKSIKTLEESVASNKNQMGILNKKIVAVDVKSNNILDKMYKSLKTLEESVASNKNQMEILNQKIVDVKSNNILDKMYKSLKTLEENAASNKNQMEILSQKIDGNILTVEEWKKEAKACNKCNGGSSGSAY